MIAQENQLNQATSYDGDGVVGQTSSSIGDVNEKKKEEPVTNMPMSHQDDLFVDWVAAIKG